MIDGIWHFLSAHGDVALGFIGGWIGCRAFYWRKRAYLETLAHALIRKQARLDGAEVRLKKAHNELAPYASKPKPQIPIN